MEEKKSNNTQFKKSNLPSKSNSRLIGELIPVFSIYVK